METIGSIDTLQHALTAYVQDGMPARKLAARTRKSTRRIFQTWYSFWTHVG